MMTKNMTHESQYYVQPEESNLNLKNDYNGFGKSLLKP